MIYLLRHGQTVFNVAHRYQGRCDSPLTALGQRQAAAMGRLLAPRLTGPMIHLCTSPLGRAVATAEGIRAALGPGSAFLHDERLAEVGMGAWDGLTRAEIAARWPHARRGHPPRQWIFHAPGGESLGAVTGRLTAILHEAAARPGDVVLVSHAMTGRMMRGLHAGLQMSEALQLDAPQNVIFALGPGGRIDRIEADVR